MKIVFLAIAIIVAGLLVWIIRRKNYFGGTPEERLLRYYQKQIQRYIPIDLPADASATDRFIKVLKDLAVQLNKCVPFAQEAVSLWRISEEGTRPLLVLVMGEFKTGKSTFINTLLGNDVLISDAAPATAVTTMLKYGEKPIVVLHYNDGHTESWPYEKLGEITAEGDESKRHLRESLDYVELAYPNDLLKRINLVDTPGLNVHRESHIRNTENFQQTAEVVLWVFNAARSVTQTEVREIKALGNRLKPFAIVNRIDNIDEEEESVEEVLNSVKRRLGNSVQGVFGLSALQAQTALQAGNRVLLQESGWIHFLEQLEKHLLSRSEELKLKALIEKAKSVAEDFKTKVEEMKRTIAARDKSFSSQAEAEQELCEKINILDDIHSQMDEVNNNIQIVGKSLKDLSANKTDHVWLFNNLELLDDLSNKLLNIIGPVLRLKTFLNSLLSGGTDKERLEISALIEDIEMLDGEIDHQVEELRKWQQEFEELLVEADNLNTEKKQIDVLRNDYDHSGLFGGEPIFDFSGRRERLNNAIGEYNQHVQGLQEHKIKVFYKFFSISEDTYAKDKEIGGIAKRIDSFFVPYKEQTVSQLESVQQDFQREQEHQAEMKNHLKIGEALLRKLQQEIPA